jgi:hypothetical protein|tara:strand:+ start:698 stop:850 length:153 start_codon:yes stop_codon:yes gene_type:complete
MSQMMMSLKNCIFGISNEKSFTWQKALRSMVIVMVGYGGYLGIKAIVEWL